eukprot:3642160-Rhodomonas_salina.3
MPSRGAESPELHLSRSINASAIALFPKTCGHLSASSINPLCVSPAISGLLTLGFLSIAIRGERIASTALSFFWSRITFCTHAGMPDIAHPRVPRDCSPQVEFQGSPSPPFVPFFPSRFPSRGSQGAEGARGGMHWR